MRAASLISATESHRLCQCLPINTSKQVKDTHATHLVALSHNGLQFIGDIAQNPIIHNVYQTQKSCRG